jgi:hypothetical protein
LVGCVIRPSATSPASSVIFGRPPPRKIGISGCAIGPGIEERLEAREAVVLALERERRAGLERARKIARSADVLAHARDGAVHGVEYRRSMFAAHLRAEPELEAAARRGREVPGGDRDEHRAARERDRARSWRGAARVVTRSAAWQSRKAVVTASGTHSRRSRAPRRAARVASTGVEAHALIHRGIHLPSSNHRQAGRRSRPTRSEPKASEDHWARRSVAAVDEARLRR